MEIEKDKATQEKAINKLETQLRTAHTSVHTLQQRLYRFEKKDDLTYQKNTELRSRLNDVEEEFSSKVAELEEKLNCLLRKSNLHITNELSFLNTSMIFSPTLFARKR